MSSQGSRRQPGRREGFPIFLGVAALMLLVVATACGGSESADDDQSSPAPTPTPTQTRAEGEVGIVLKDRHVSADPASAPAGEVTFDVRNEGPSRHELVVIRTDLPENELPTEGEGGFETTVDEKAKELEIVDEQEDVLADTSATLTVDLEAGSYVLICNIGGHYLGGMHTAFSVT